MNRRSEWVRRGAWTVAAMVVVACMVSFAGADEPKPSRDRPAPDQRSDKDEKKKSDADKKKEEKPATMPALNYKMKDISGKERDLKEFGGNVVLMVNVASKCGLTPHYEGLQGLYDKYHERGFVILGFPANNFGKQEPGTNDEIKTFCTKNFGVTFPMFAKVSVKGDDICDLYKYLTDEKADHKQGGEIEWNFAKILVDRQGRVVDRFSPPTTPDDKMIVEAIEKQLEKPVPADSALGKERSKKKTPTTQPAKD